MALLKAHDAEPSTSDLRALGTGVDEVLAAIAADAQVELPLRARALGALRLLPTRATRDFLTTFVKQQSGSDADKALLRQAALSLGWVGGTSAADTLAPLLEHADPDVRVDAAMALGLTRSSDAADWLRQRFGEEKDQRVRTQIGRQLRLLEREASAPPAASDTK